MWRPTDILLFLLRDGAGTVAAYLLVSLFLKWIISWGGAQTLAESAIASWLCDFWAPADNPEQIRLCALALWVLASVLVMLWLLFRVFQA